MSVLKIKRNGKWIPVSVGAQGPQGPRGAAGEGSGDMAAEVYDPQGKAQDIFAYADAAGGAFIAEYGVTTIEEIEAALAAGKFVGIQYADGEARGHLIGCFEQVARFALTFVWEAGEDPASGMQNAEVNEMFLVCTPEGWREENSTHASRHWAGGSDPINPDLIGAVSAEYLQQEINWMIEYAKGEIKTHNEDETAHADIREAASSKASIYSYQKKLAAKEWFTNTITLDLAQLKSTSVVFISPVKSSRDAYIAAGVRGTAYSRNEVAFFIDFTCETVPEADLVVDIVIVNGTRASLTTFNVDSSGGGGGIQTIKLKEVTTTAAAAQVEFDLSDIDLDKYQELKFCMHLLPLRAGATGEVYEIRAAFNTLDTNYMLSCYHMHSNASIAYLYGLTSDTSTNMYPTDWTIQAHISEVASNLSAELGKRSVVGLSYCATRNSLGKNTDITSTTCYYHAFLTELSKLILSIPGSGQQFAAGSKLTVYGVLR